MRLSALIAAVGLLCGLGPALGHAALSGAREDPDFGRSPVARPLGSPPGANAVPARPLTDAELYRMLLVLSARTRPPMDALAACYPFGRPGWRDCVTQR